MVKKVFLLVFLLQGLAVSLWAQMTDEQVIVWVQNAQKQGMGQQEMVLKLMQRGVTQQQLMRLKETYTKQKSGEYTPNETDDRMRTPLEKPEKNTEWSRDNMQVKKKPQGTEETREPLNADITLLKEYTLFDSLSDGIMRYQETEKKENEVFGRNIFNNELLTFEPNINIATPANYVLGPGDEVIVDIWGDSEQTIRQRISPDGTITIAKLGPVFLNGLTIREANSRLKATFSKIYSSMRGSNPTTFINLSLGEIRSISVNVVGEVQMPGTYTLPSLASLFHALYSAGGVNDIGSLRSVKVSRAGEVLADVDVYQYLLKGKSDMDIRLEDGDVILVSPYQNLVTLKGKVKRPLIYEMKEDETVGDLLDYAGGFTGDAYKKAVRIIRKAGREYQVYNVDKDDFTAFALTDKDEVEVDSVLNRFENKVEIRGAVYRPGLYAVSEDVSTVRQLIEKSEGLRGDAFLNRAVLYRERPDLTLEALSVDVIGILNGKTEDIVLAKNDVLYIPALTDLQEEYTVTVYGEVGLPDTYKYVADMTVEDLIIQAGGLKDAASVVRIDVARRIKNPKSLDYSGKSAENFTLVLKDGLMVEGKRDFVLQPFDEVYVRTSPGYKKQENVKIEGEVLFAGSYSLSQRGERLSDLIKRAGGLTPDAYVAGARLTRKLSEDEQARKEALVKLAEMTGGRDSMDMEHIDLADVYYVGIDLPKALANPGSDDDVVLREGDVLTVPEYISTVKISGAVMYPNTVIFQKGKKLRYYIEQAGGFGNRAKRRKAYIVYMNGQVAKAKLTKAQTAPGCEIIVPLRPNRKGIGLAEIMGIANSTTSMAALVTSIINSTK